MARSSWERLVQVVRAEAPFGSDADAEHAVTFAIGALGAALRYRERSELAGWLPERATAILTSTQYRGALTVDELVDVVREDEATNRRWAREHLVVACRALGDAIGPEARTWIERHLGSEWAALFVPRSPLTAPPTRASTGEIHSTLAEDRPGSRHPVSQSAPRVEQSGSVTATDTAERRTLSSAGPTGDELAEAELGSRRTIAGD